MLSISSITYLVLIFLSVLELFRVLTINYPSLWMPKVDIFRELIEKETNEYKRNALESELRNVEYAKKVLTHLIQSLQSESSSCEGADGRNPEQRKVAKTTLQSAWQVLRVAFLFPILGRVLPRNLSPLKPILVEGVWDGVRSRSAPLEVGGASR